MIGRVSTLRVTHIFFKLAYFINFVNCLLLLRWPRCERAACQRFKFTTEWYTVDIALKMSSYLPKPRPFDTAKPAQLPLVDSIQSGTRLHALRSFLTHCGGLRYPEAGPAILHFFLFPCHLNNSLELGRMPIQLMGVASMDRSIGKSSIVILDVFTRNIA